jgi:KDO2-lipid IV(A) lauroyltransferase
VSSTKRVLTPVARALGRAGLRTLIQALRYYPGGHDRALALGRSLGRLVWRTQPRRRRVALRNARIAYGDDLPPAERERIVRASFEHFGMTAVETIRFAYMSDAHAESLLHVDPASYDELRDVLARGHGCLLVTGHVGNFEVMGRWLAARGHEVIALAREAADPGTTALMVALRARNGIRVVTRRQSLRPIYEGLARGACVAIIADQNSKDVVAPFFGQPTGTFDGPARIALKSGAALLFFSCVRDGRGGFTVRSHGHVWPEPTDDRRADVVRLTTAVNAHLEAIIRAHPEQWLWMHNRWRSSPPVRQRYGF